MANSLKMADVQSILSLHALRWSQRRIARELGVDRETVRKILKQRSHGPKPAKVLTGSDAQNQPLFDPSRLELPKPAKLPTGAAPITATQSAGSHAEVPPENPAQHEQSFVVSDGPGPPATTSPTTSPGTSPRVSHNRCEPYREQIVALVEQGLSARRIWQDLLADGAELKYDSVRRFLNILHGSRPLPFRRMECGPGEEAQVDFGSGMWVVSPEGKRRKTHVFRIVLSHSRKGYSEATHTQSADDFFRCLENAFALFGGVPKTLVIDNLKAAVAHPEWFDPVLSPKVQSFCHHYGTVILPTKPRMPRHKGKIEAGVKYVKNNALKGRRFANLEEANRALGDWEANVADTRIHGTTKRQVAHLFRAVEQPALLSPPLERFPCFREARRRVHRDGHVEVARAYYSVPPEYLGREVWARWDTRLVRVFNHRFEQIALHARQESGRFSTLGEHIAPEKINGIERGAAYLLARVGTIGPQTRQWAEAMLTARGVQGTRVLQGVLSLTKKHSSETLEKACETALSHGCFVLRSVRKLLDRQVAAQQPLPFLDEHPFIRPLDDYAAVVRRALERQADRPSLDEGFSQGGFFRHGWAMEPPLPKPPDAEPPDLKRPASQQETGLESGCLPGPRGVPPPSPGYPSSSCSSAELDSVSPGNSNVVHDSLFDNSYSHQKEQCYE